VGFRYTTLSVAATYPVAGYVRNLPTGQVELVAEGEEESVQAFLAVVGKHLAHRIEETTIVEEAPTGARGFVIRR
jgi:acylphosphatase